MAPMYRHQPLKSQRSIRVFSILPSRDCKAPIQGTLSEVNLDSNPLFEALSYVWGRPEPGNAVTILTLSIGGAEKASSCLDVTPNCLSALKTLRLRFKPRKLWIDAICIDQNSIPEKSQQVPLMTEIYGGGQTRPGVVEYRKREQEASSADFTINPQCGMAL